MKHHGAAISVAAKDWVDRYKAGRAAATAELLTFLLQARLMGAGALACSRLWVLSSTDAGCVAATRSWSHG